MNEQYQNPQLGYQGSDEIDLFELCQTLWEEKLLIIIVGVICTGLALAYALIATPVYQAQATLAPPHAYAIQGYNDGRILKDFSSEDKFARNDSEFSVDDIYDVFTKNLNSSQLRSQFLDKIYLPLLSAEDKTLNRDVLMEKLSNVVSVNPPSAKGPSVNSKLYELVVEFNDPVVAVELANQYIDYAITATKAELRNNIETEQKVNINELKLRTQSLLNIAKKEREDQIKLLKEALVIAESVGLENPSTLSDKASLGGNRYIDNDLIYTRGAKTLRAQLAVLEQRTSDEPFIKDFRELNTRLQALKDYQLNDTDVSVVLIDEAAEVPSSPIKPKKLLIVALGVVIGGMLGVFAALMRSMIRKRKNSTL